ncbi:WhiB family transcriptional regulator [Streptomyces sp. NPDC056661]|uniref:WhiB family transcriptional regulator n=1 Tax=Streptomyces sp. NPDC056661 TaxID=3345898 RepID=UPI0036792B7D
MSAACDPSDAELFFTRRRAQQAQQICASCPVRVECLAHAQSKPEPFGVWGGLTALQRGWDSMGRRRRSHAVKSAPTQAPFSDSPA